MNQKQITGKFGELEVQKYLMENNYIIMQNNFRCNFGEIDVIARDINKQEIVFIEVKTRNNNLYGKPAESINNIKKKHILKAVRYFLHRYNLEKEFIRIDVIEVYIDGNQNYNLNHIKQAF